MIKHIKTVEEFKKEIQQDKVLVDFYADWCGPCKMLAPVLEEIENEITILKINVDEVRELAIEYKVSSIPTLILFSQGKQVKTSLGYININQLKNFIA